MDRDSMNRRADESYAGKDDSQGEAPEEMRAFFTARVEGYDAHMLENVEEAPGAYSRAAELLPQGAETLLDLGCGTGLELEAAFGRFPDLRVTGVDLTAAMLERLRAKYAGRNLRLICGDYRKTDLGEARFDAALSFQTMHHLDPGQKREVYRRILRALKPGGRYVEADYLAKSQAEEEEGFARRDRLLDRADGGAGLWHIDVPMTAENQCRLLREAGFAVARLDSVWGNAGIIVAE